MEENYLTVQEVSKRLKVSRQTVTRWIHDGQLKALKLGDRMYRITENDLEQFLSSNQLKK